MRNPGLDVLRAIAVILVLARHSNLNFWLTKFGWLGVDLFFVLSGFLVAGLLFAEYKKHGAIDLKRFLVKRAFKILPPFYVFLGISLLFESVYGSGPLITPKLRNEVLYVQSYLPGKWPHTWSLALEVHFYLLLAALAALISSIRVKIKPFAAISFFLCLLLAGFLLRLHYSFPHRQESFFAFFQSHLRADGIIFGVLLAYLYHFTSYTSLPANNKISSFLIGLALIAPAFYFQGGSFFMNTTGLTLVNCGFMILVFLSLDLAKGLQGSLKHLRFPAKTLAFIGLHSYSVYLWHLHAKDVLYHYFSFDEKLMTVLYVLFAIITGIGMSFLVEKTCLKLREMLYPGKTNPLI